MKKLNFLHLTVLFFCIFVSGNLSAKESNSIFIEKFKIHSPEKGDEFLIPGIDSILKTKISSAKGIIITENRDKSDYIVSGSVVIIGNSCITSGSMSKFGNQILTFSKKGNSKSDVLDHIYELAEKCTKKAEPLVITEKEIKAEPTAIREKAVKINQSSDIIMSTGLMDIDIKGLVAEDFNGDKSPEIAWLTKDNIVIAGIESGNIKILNSIKIPKGLQPISLETAKFGPSKGIELIANLYDSKRERFRSLSYAIDPSDLSLKKGNLPGNYLYRAIYSHSGNKQIIAKKGGVSGDIFFGGIMTVEKDKNYSFNKFDFTKSFSFFPSVSSGFYTQTTKPEWSILKDGNLKIYSNDLQQIWQSSEKLGGSTSFIDIKAKTRNEIGERYYISPRIITIPGKNGNSRIITAQNIDTGKRLLQRLRFFKEGFIKSISWNKITFEDEFISRKFQGWVSDFAVYDIDHDGKLELIIANPQKFGTFSSKTKTRVVIVEFEV